MSDSDVLADLLGNPETRTARKPENILGRGKGESDDAGGYDLTNPNLHHGVEDTYKPFRSPEQSRSGHSIGVAAFSAGISDGLQVQTGESGSAATHIADQSANGGENHSFDISSHFAAPVTGEALTFSAALPAGLSIDAHTGVISGMPADGNFGNNSITVTAIDARGVAVSESFLLQVNDRGPTATAIGNQSAYEGQAFSLDISNHFAAPAGDTLTFSASLPAGLSINSHTGIISGVPDDGAFGDNTITVTATGAHGMVIRESFHLQVNDSGPTATPIINHDAYEGQSFSLDVSNHFAASAPGNTLTFSGSLPTGLSIDAHTGIISGVPTDSDFGDNPITVTATDAHGMAISSSFHLQVNDSGPTTTPIANQGAYEGQSFSLDISSHFVAPAADNTLTFSASLPAGLSIDALTGIISGVPTDSDFTSSAHEYNFNFTSFDGRFTVTGQLITSQSLDAAGGYDVTGITGSVVGPSGAIITGLIANPSHTVGSISPDGVWIYDNILYADRSTLVDYGGVLFTSNNYEYNIFYDAGHYILETLNPQGILNPGESGSFTISAVPADHPITVTATDAHGMAVSQTFRLEVADSGPTATIIPDQSAHAGRAFSLDTSHHFTAPAAGDTLTFFGSMPAGLSIDAHTGIISGVPTNSDLGTNSITVTAIDDHGMTVSETFVLQVGDNAPVITSNGAGDVASVNVAENATAVTAMMASDHGSGLTLTYSIAGGADASHFTIDASTGALAFVSAPDYEHPTDAGGNNVYDVTVKVSDGTLTDTQAMAVTVTNVNDNTPVIGSNGAAATASVNVAENTSAVTVVTATDADAGSTLTYSIAGGVDASHFTIDASTGALSFVSAPDYENPTNAGRDNVYDVTVKASDGTFTDTQAIAVTVTDIAENIQLGTGGVTFTDTGVTELSITGGIGNDTITGTAGVDHLYGGAGNDTIVGGRGADILDGGTGTDTVDYSTSSAGVTINLANSGLQSGGDAAGDILSNFENVTGSAFNDMLIGDAGANVLTGGAGNDVLIGDNTANMLVNGSFEADHIAAGSWVPTSTLTGWTAASGGFETWNHLTVGGHTYTASDGVQSIELDAATGLDSFYQDVQTVSGAHYTLSFDAAMRADAPSSTQTIQVYWNGNLIDSFDPTSTSWVAHGYALTGDGGIDRLTFSEVSAENDSYGGLIDNVSLVPVSGGNDILDGGAGNDTLVGGPGNDVLIGGSGIDTADYSTATAVTVNLSTTAAQDTGGAGIDTLSGIENLTGSGYNDVLTGDANNNVILGGAGNDLLIGDGVATNLIVNGSFETPVVGDNSNQLFSAITGWTADTGQIQIKGAGYGGQYADEGTQFADLDADTGVDSFHQDIHTTNGQSYQLSFDAAGRSGYADTTQTINVYWNGTLIDSFDPSGTSYETHTYSVIGTGGLDRLTFAESSADNDTIGAALDNVTLFATSSDTLDGGAGNDTLVGGTGADTLIGGSGIDTADYSTSANGVTVNLTTNVNTGGDAQGDSLTGIENVTGSNYNDTLTGDSNDNTLSGGAGNNTLIGGAGNDTLIGGSGNDTLVGGTGIDTADYSTAAGGVTVNLSVGAAQNTVHAGTDTLSGIENLTGSSFNDTLSGDSNDNVITGGKGNDALAGGNGSDTFIYRVGDGNDTVAGGAGANWTDTINLHDGTSALGTYGVDWTISITSGSILSADTAHHTIALSQDTAGHIDLSNGATINFSELERITW